MAIFNSKIEAYLGFTPNWLTDVMVEHDRGISKIIYWDEVKCGKSQPTDEQLNALESEATTLENNNEVIATRTKLYGTTAEQLEYIVENGVDAFVTKQNQIKLDNPKG